MKRSEGKGKQFARFMLSSGLPVLMFLLATVIACLILFVADWVFGGIYVRSYESDNVPTRSGAQEADLQDASTYRYYLDISPSMIGYSASEGRMSTVGQALLSLSGNTSNYYTCGSVVKQVEDASFFEYFENTEALTKLYNQILVDPDSGTAAQEFDLCRIFTDQYDGQAFDSSSNMVNVIITDLNFLKDQSDLDGHNSRLDRFAEYLSMYIKDCNFNIYCIRSSHRGSPTDEYSPIDRETSNQDGSFFIIILAQNNGLYRYYVKNFEKAFEDYAILLTEKHQLLNDPVGDNHTINVDRNSDFYKSCICVKKTTEESIKEEEVEVNWSEGTEPPVFHINDEYKSMFVICMDNPGKGNYQIVLPNRANNEYVVVNQTNVDLLSLNIGLRGEQMKYIESRPPTYTFPDGKTECQLVVSLKHSGIAEEDIVKCWYTVSLKREDNIANVGATEISESIDWNDWNEDLSTASVQFKLPEPSPKPADISAITYTIQAYLSLKDVEPIVESNLIWAQPKEFKEVPCKDFSGFLGNEIDISPQNWPKVDASDDPDDFGYYMLEQSLVPGEDLADKVFLPIPYDGELCKLMEDDKGAVKITFKQPGEYFIAIKNRYGGWNAEAEGHFIISDNRNNPKIVLIIVATIGIVAAFVVYVVRVKRRK